MVSRASAGRPGRISAVVEAIAVVGREVLRRVAVVARPGEVLLEPVGPGPAVQVIGGVVVPAVEGVVPGFAVQVVGPVPAEQGDGGLPREALPPCSMRLERSSFAALQIRN